MHIKENKYELCKILKLYSRTALYTKNRKCDSSTNKEENY